MQNDNTNNFDREIREILDGAEIAPPRQVWRAVRNAMPVRGFHRAYAVLAFACIFAVVAIIGLRNENHFISPSESNELLADSDCGGLQQVVSEDTLLDREQIDAADKSSTSEPRRAIAIKAQKEVSVQSVVTDELVAESAPIKEEEDVKPNNTSLSEESSPSVSKKKIDYTLGGKDDPLRDESLETQISKKLKDGRISLAFNGTAGGNDSDLGSYLGRVFHYADGAENVEKLGLSESSSSTYSVPVSLGLGVKFRLNKTLSVGTGINYSFLERNFTGSYRKDASSAPITGDTYHRMQYLGVPLNLYYEPFNLKTFRFYTFAGGQAEFCVNNRYLMPGKDMDFKTKVNGALFSTNLGIGAEFKITEQLGFYFDPSVKYYFKSSHPKSVHTEKPLSVNFDIGLRINL